MSPWDPTSYLVLQPYPPKKADGIRVASNIGHHHLFERTIKWVKRHVDDEAEHRGWWWCCVLLARTKCGVVAPVLWVVLTHGAVQPQNRCGGDRSPSCHPACCTMAPHSAQPPICLCSQLKHQSQQMEFRL